MESASSIFPHAKESESKKVCRAARPPSAHEDQVIQIVSTDAFAFILRRPREDAMDAVKASKKTSSVQQLCSRW